MTRDLCYRFDDIEVQRLKLLLDRHGAMLGMRGHYLANAPSPFAREHFDGRTLVDLDHASFHELAPLLRESAVVLTDYSSVYIDALYLDLPVVSFAYDLEHYSQRQNGLLYDMELAFPACVPDERYRAAQRLFFQHGDAGNSRRLVERLQAAIAARSPR